MKTNVLEYFAPVVLSFNDKLAIVDRETTLSFGRLHMEALNLASLLVAAQDPIKRPIAVFLPKSKDAVVSILAILYTANFYVPLDVKTPTSRLSTILNNLEPIVVVTNRSALVQLANAGWPVNKTVLVDEQTKTGPALDAAWVKARCARLIDTDPVYIIYTSGSTGTPKGVVIPHRGVISYIDCARECYAVSENEV